jgi:hypothetical protein
VTRPKRHHYLPQFYLDGFTRDGLFWLFDRKKGEFRKQTPINTAVESGFYTVRMSDGTDSDAVEETLATIEGVVKPAVDRLDAAESISDEDRRSTAAFIATLYLRTPGFRRNHDAAHETMMKRTMQILYSDPGAAAARLECMKAAGEDVGGLTPEKIMEAAKNADDYSIELPPEQSIQSMLSLLPKIGTLLADMRWTIAHAPANKVFVASDEPFVLIPPPDYRPGVQGLGIASPGTTKVIPLSQRICVLIGDVDPLAPVQHVDVGADWVRAINMNVTQNCERFVISPVEALVRSLVHATAVDRTEPRLRFHVK